MANEGIVKHRHQDTAAITARSLGRRNVRKGEQMAKLDPSLHEVLLKMKVFFFY